MSGLGPFLLGLAAPDEEIGGVRLLELFAELVPRRIRKDGVFGRSGGKVRSA